MITNRKRPRGFSESFDPTSKTTRTEAVNPFEDALASSSDFIYDLPGNLNLNISLDGSDATGNTTAVESLRKAYGSDSSDVYVIADEDDIDEDDDDLVILEERKIPQRVPRPRRNNLDLVLLVDNDSVAAYNMFNVNNAENVSPEAFEIVPDLSSAIKKQRTNSLPQLPQARCFYNKIPDNYILQHPKLGNIKTNVIPHKLNLPPCDDKEGHYIIRINDVFANRFYITKLLGQGTFGKVVECYDKINRETVAIKIIRNIPKYRDAAKIELRILLTLKKFDNKNRNHCIHLRECFDYRGHICIVTDLLKISLYDFLENNKYIPYPGLHIQAIAKQLIRLVTFLHDLNLIHTDLKPENILLHDDAYFKKPLSSSTIALAYRNLHGDSKKEAKMPKTARFLKNPLIQVIDFGSAIFNDEYHLLIVSTRHYRAPEIVLGVGWSFPCDLWLVGCILVELVIGEPLFRTHDNLEHLAMIERICGCKIDRLMVRMLKERDNECGIKFFTEDYVSRGSVSLDEEVEIDDMSSEEAALLLVFPGPTTTDKSISSVDQLARIDVFISRKIGLSIDFDRSLSDNYLENKHVINFGNFTFWWFFIDLLRQLFVVRPQDRLTAAEALHHPWFNLGIEDEGTI